MRLQQMVSRRRYVWCYLYREVKSDTVETAHYSATWIAASSASNTPRKDHPLEKNLDLCWRKSCTSWTAWSYWHGFARKLDRSKRSCHPELEKFKTILILQNGNTSPEKKMLHMTCLEAYQYKVYSRDGNPDPISLDAQKTYGSKPRQQWMKIK